MLETNAKRLEIIRGVCRRGGITNMGIRNSGLIIGKDRSRQIDLIENHFHVILYKKEQITFEDAFVEDKFDEHYFDIYSTDSGTIMFMSPIYYSYFSLCSISQICEVVNFEVDETTMKFFLYRNDEEIGRHYISLDQEFIDDSSKPFLSICENDDMVYDTLSGLMKKYLGKNQNEIELSEKAYRYYVLGKQNFPSIDFDDKVAKEKLQRKLLAEKVCS
jgi:hypothetical protein